MKLLILCKSISIFKATHLDRLLQPNIHVHVDADLYEPEDQNMYMFLFYFKFVSLSVSMSMSTSMPISSLRTCRSRSLLVVFFKKKNLASVSINLKVQMKVSKTCAKNQDLQSEFLGKKIVDHTYKQLI